ncbi:MAG: hypothetical protein JKY27_01405 [Magnetovibrio sp.]|nr:hypothetical protein [Magnetovibrio sp.]
MSEAVRIRAMSVLTPMADDPDELFQRVQQGGSAVTYWKNDLGPRCSSKIGGDLSDYPIGEALKALRAELPREMASRVRRIAGRAPRSLQYTLWLALQAWKSAGPSDWSSKRTGVIVAGHNLNRSHVRENYLQFEQEPLLMDPLFSIFALDTTHVSAVSDVLGITGVSHTVGAACASGAQAFRTAQMEISAGHLDRVYVVSPVYEPTPPDLEALAQIGAIALDGIDGDPSDASRPFEMGRKGFVPAHGGACFVVDRILPQNQNEPGLVLRSAAACVDGQYEPVPNKDGQIRAMSEALDQAGISPSDIGFVSAHATSTPLGDRVEMEALRAVFDEPVPVTAPKASLGHTLWSSASVETVLALKQLQARTLPALLNFKSPDPECAWDQGRDTVRHFESPFVLKNSFGFGGYNCAMVFETRGT